jgi:hypothetical protein
MCCFARVPAPLPALWCSAYAVFSCLTACVLSCCVLHRRRHGQGLQLLQQLSQSPGSMAIPPSGAAADLKGLPGVWAAVRWAHDLCYMILSVQMHQVDGVLVGSIQSMCVCCSATYLLLSPFMLQVPDCHAAARLAAAGCACRLGAGS